MRGGYAGRGGLHRGRKSADPAVGNRRPVTSQVAGDRKGRPDGGMKPWSGGTHGSRPTRHYFVGADAYTGPVAPICKSCVGQGPRALPVGVVENRFGSSARPTPTHHLPIELRKGRRLPTVVPTDSRALSRPPIGALPRNRLASSATGSASAISPTPRWHQLSSFA